MMHNPHAPRHIAFIMDGNGRWAQARKLPRVKGHEAGAETIRKITTFCAKDPRIETATFYAFSTENWKRPKSEVVFLMRLLLRYLKGERETFMRHNIRFLAIGDTDAFSDDIRNEIAALEEETKDHTALTQVLALNYGGRLEITEAANRLIARGEQTLTREMLSEALQTPYSELDIMVRTGGEMRLSNFLLWQSSYAELFFTETMWPDFDEAELSKILEAYEGRERRFGAIHA